MLRLSIFPFLIALLGCAWLSAQDLHVHYDAHTDSVYYVQGGKTTDRPAVRKGSQVILHVNNYNNYLYNVQVKSQQTHTSLAAANPADFSKLLPGGDDGGSPLDLIFGSGSVLGGLTNFSGGMLTSGMATSPAAKEAQAQMEKIEQQVQVFNRAKSSAEKRAATIVKIQKEVKMELEAQQIQTFAMEELQLLRFNPQLSPAQIKNLSKEYMSRVLGKDDPKQVSLSEVLQKLETKNNFAALQQEYQEEVAGYAKDVSLMKATNGILQLLAATVPAEEELESFQSDAARVTSTAEGNLTTYQRNNEAFAAKTDSIQGLGLRELTDMRTNYLVTMENDFSKTFRHTAAGDQMDFSVVLTPVDSVSIQGLATRAASPIEIKVYGGMQVNASVGLGFGQFFSRPQGYFVRDSVVQSTDKDAFTPFLTSFVHFYPQSRGETSLGGSFGIGIPLSGGSGGSSLESITFFLGPSLILGRSQRIVLSGGLIGGRVSQLANGYKVGDKFEAQPDLLQTESVYRLGYAVGLSFNLTGKS